MLKSCGGKGEKITYVHTYVSVYTLYIYTYKAHTYIHMYVCVCMYLIQVMKGHYETKYFQRCFACFYANMMLFYVL